MSHVNATRTATLLVAVLVLIGLGCARIPYTTSVVHEDQRVAVMLQREITPSGYTHPVQITPQQVAAILHGEKRVLKGAMREKQAPKMWRLAEQCHGDSQEACLALRGM